MSNKDKQLLNESTVRRFMGLAGIGALSDTFVEDSSLNEQLPTPPPKKGLGKPDTKPIRTPEKTELEEAEELEEALGDEDEDEMDVAAGPPELGGEEGLDLGGEEAMAPEASDAVRTALEDVLGAVAEVAAEHGVDVDVEPEGEEGLPPGEEEGEGGLPAFEPVEGEEGAFPPAAAEEEELGLEEAKYRAAQEQHAQEMFMEELSRRVANRVRKEHIVEQVTKRVARRLQEHTKRTKRRR